MAFSTPALVINKTKVPRNRSTQDIIDDSSPVSPEGCSPPASPTAWNTLPEPIEFDSSLIPQSSPPERLYEGRSPKRRRISIASSEPEQSPVKQEDSDSQQSEDTDPLSLPDAIPEDDHDVHDDYNHDYDDHDKNDTAILLSTNKPSFHPAPRFKPADPPYNTTILPSHPDTYLDSIFSPQRRGAKYLAGGLAAELRDWLVDVKGGVDGEGEVRASSAVLGFDVLAGASAAVVRIVVEEVSAGGPGMALVAGRVVDGPGEGVRVTLAGEGSVKGLGGNRGRVVPGAVVAVAPPAWDVELDGRWAVACRWEVVDGEDSGRGVIFETQG